MLARFSRLLGTAPEWASWLAPKGAHSVLRCEKVGDPPPAPHWHPPRRRAGTDRRRHGLSSPCQIRRPDLPHQFEGRAECAGVRSVVRRLPAQRHRFATARGGHGRRQANRARRPRFHQRYVASLAAHHRSRAGAEGHLRRRTGRRAAGRGPGRRPGGGHRHGRREDTAATGRRAVGPGLPRAHRELLSRRPLHPRSPAQGSGTPSAVAGASAGGAEGGPRALRDDAGDGSGNHREGRPLQPGSGGRRDGQPRRPLLGPRRARGPGRRGLGGGGVEPLPGARLLLQGERRRPLPAGGGIGAAAAVAGRPSAGRRGAAHGGLGHPGRSAPAAHRGTRD